MASDAWWLSFRPATGSGRNMGLILLEALLALAILLAIVWWTMFSGRKRGELRDPPPAPPEAGPPAPQEAPRD
ncbi:hypothetical protein [Pulveribacter suum]|uniref:hypothetical protein n=1 Tax=Pulveribacter suum TaxID=2116657 RepID=UPI0014757071|nr:hypothetical protein [Pulveribacter suum]